MEYSSLLLFLVSFVACLFGTFYVYFSNKYSHWKKKGIPYLEPRIPMGNIADMIFFRKSFGLLMADMYQKLKGNKFGGIYQWHVPTLIVRDPELIKDILVKDFDHFHDHGIAFDETVDPLSCNLFMLTGERWKDLRNKLSPTFTSGKMKMMFKTFVECGHEFEDFLKEPANRGDIVEIKDIMAKFTTDIIASCAFGIQCNCLKNPDSEFRHWGRKVFEPSFERILTGMLYFLAPSIAIALKLQNNSKSVTNFFRRIVRETVEYRETNNVRRNDFMQLLIQLKNNGTVDEVSSPQSFEKKTALSLDELTAQAFIFFAAGFETSSTTMTFCLYELSLNPHVQKNLQNEIDAVLKKHGNIITYEAIQEMTYLDKTVSETLRKYPVAPQLMRDCNKDYKIPGTDVVIEKGTKIVIPIIALHHDPQYFPNPDKFDPERFNEEVKHQRHHYTYLPFGEGPRICIGMRFGLLQTKVGLVCALSRYEFHLCNKTSVPLSMDPAVFTLSPTGGVWLQIKNRVPENN